LPLVIAVAANYNGFTTYYKGSPIIDVFLNSMKKTDYGNYKVVVADGCSTDGSLNHIKKNFPDILLLSDKKNIGLARSLNRAMRFAINKYNPQYILLLNNDLIITDPKWVTKMVEVAEADDRIGLVGCKLVYANGKIQHAGAVAGLAPHNRGRGETDTGQYDKIEDIGAVTGAVLLIKNTLMEKIGLWDGNFFMGYEDIDYCLRARNAGFKIIYDGKVELIHLEGSTTTNSKDNSRRDLMLFTSQRNYMYYALKNYGLLGWFEVIGLALVGSVIGIEGKDAARGLEGFRFKDKPLLRIWKTIRAIPASYGLWNSAIKR
jgi:hypothetical protein